MPDLFEICQYNTDNEFYLNFIYLTAQKLQYLEQVAWKRRRLQLLIYMSFTY